MLPLDVYLREAWPMMVVRIGAPIRYNGWVSLKFRYSFDKSFRITDVTMLTLTYGHYLPTKDC